MNSRSARAGSLARVAALAFAIALSMTLTGCHAFLEGALYGPDRNGHSTSDASGPPGGARLGRHFRRECR